MSSTARLALLVALGRPDRQLDPATDQRSASLAPVRCSSQRKGIRPGSVHRQHKLSSSLQAARKKVVRVQALGGEGNAGSAEEDKKDSINAANPPSSSAEVEPSAAESAEPVPKLGVKGFDSASPSGTTLQTISLEDVNPVDLGRRSRQFLDDVWRRLLSLGQLSRPLEPLEPEEQEALILGPNCEFAIPNAELTKVLVVGATGRVGRVLVRKLLLRGYSVRVLVRRADFQTMEQLPGAVEVMEADLESDISTASLMQAVSGCQKVIYCATAGLQSPDPQRLASVDEGGVVMVAKAMMDYNHHLAQRRAGRSRKSKAVVVKLNKDRYQQGWRLAEGKAPGFGLRAGQDVDDDVAAVAADADFEITEAGHGLFQGYVVERGAYVEVKRVVDMPAGLSLNRFEGLVLRVVGDGKPYSLVLECDNSKRASLQVVDSEGERAQMNGGPSGLNWSGTADRPWAEVVHGPSNGAPANPRPAGPCQYSARFVTRRGPSTIRIPFTAFRPLELGVPPLDPGAVTSLALRFEQKRPRSTAAFPPAAAAAPDGSDPNSFRLELDFIKAFPGGDETDFILVSCTGAAAPEDSRPLILKAKLAAETQLRNSGLGYTIIRPGPLFEEPGGRRALVFDQGNRISQGISCADVADVCVKALHDPLARNKSFDVCYEYSDGSGLYELVAHLPDKANNYLTPALALLEKNT